MSRGYSLHKAGNNVQRTPNHQKLGQKQMWHSQIRQQSKQKQNMLMDQHYSNNIMMTALSTLQSLQAASKMMKVGKEDKLYGYYDKVNYNQKNYSELKSQLQVQLGLAKASKIGFSMDYPKDKYKMPSSFNQNKLGNEIIRFKQSFRNNDNEVYRMCEDFQKINNGNLHNNFSFQSKNYAVEYPKEKAYENKKSIFTRGMHASNIMDYEKSKFDDFKYKSRQDLPIQVNYHKKTQPSNYHYTCNQKRHN